MLGERYLINESCPFCGNPVYADEGYYSTSKAHASCHSKSKEEGKKAFERLDAVLESFTGRKPKKPRKRRGFGQSTATLCAMIETALKKKFDTTDVLDVIVCPASPVWCRDKYDVMRLEGSAKVGGISVNFGSWATISELIKYREVKFDDDWPAMGLAPDYDTRRSRSKTNSGEGTP